MWSRFESGDEGEAAWAAFSEYLHLATPRLSVEEFARSHRTPGLVLKWSMQWMWESRVDAYDEYTSQANIRKFYPVTSPLIIRVMRLCLAELQKWEAAQKDSTVGFIPFRDCLSMLREVRAAERDLARMTKEQEEAKLAGAVAHDFSKLTLEEQRLLDGLLAKVSG